MVDWKKALPTTDVPQARAHAIVMGLVGDSPDIKVYVKWTCPACGDRCVCDQPNTFYSRYEHGTREDGTPCGGVYGSTLADAPGLLVGLVAIIDLKAARERRHG